MLFDRKSGIEKFKKMLDEACADPPPPEKDVPWYRFPTPIELGRTAHDGLPIRRFSKNDVDAYTWEDYEEEICKLYPVRGVLYYKVWESIIENKFYFPLRRRVLDGFYYILDRFYRKQHFLSLQQDGCCGEKYSYGWLDHDTQVLYALANILCSWIELDMGSIYELQEPGKTELKLAYKYWKEGRNTLIDARDAIEPHLTEDREKFHADIKAYDDAGNALIEADTKFMNTIIKYRFDMPT